MNNFYGRPSKDSPPPLLRHPVIQQIAKKRGCTAAQTVLAWGIGRGTGVVPKRIHRGYIRENFGAKEDRCQLRNEDRKAVQEIGVKSMKRFNNPSRGWGVKLYEGLDKAEEGWFL